MPPSRLLRQARPSDSPEHDANTILVPYVPDSTLGSPTTGSIGQPSASALAWKKHVDSLSPTERQYFLKEDLRAQGFEAYVVAISTACQGLQERSRGIKSANWVRPFFQLYNFFTPTLSAMSAASPIVTPTPFVLGAITCIMQISSNYTQYQEKLGEILQDMIFRLSILFKYETYVYQEDEEIQEALVNVYGDILDLCRRALRLFVNEKGKIHGSGTTFVKSLTGSFDAHFEEVTKNYQRHLQIFRERARLRDKIQEQQHQESASVFQQNVDRSLNTMHQFHSSATRAFLQSQDILTSRYEQKDLARERESALREQEKKAQIREQIIERIPAVDFERTHDIICDLHLEGTCDWFFCHETFQSWRMSEESSLLWVKGKAGSGKSVLASQTIRHLETLTDSLNYVYCNALMVPERSSVEAGDEAIIFLGSILKQLCQAQAEVEPVVEELYKRANGQKKLNPSYQTLRKTLSSILASRDVTTLVVDGLDECQDIEKVSKFLVSLVREEGTVVKVIVFSRPNYRAIDSTFDGYPNIIVDSGANETDLSAFIQVQLEKLGFDLRKHEQFLQKVKDKMLEKSEGMFLWVQLVVPSLRRHRRQDDIIRSLDTVPIGLTDVYDSALKKIYNLGPVEREEALSLLLWTTNAMSSLSSEEMLEAVVVEPGTKSLEGVLALSGTALAQSCADLVILDRNGYFRLVHSSLKEYLKNLPADGPPHVLEYRNMQERANEILGEVCITYLLFEEFQQSQPRSKEDVNELLKNHPFLGYATSRWAKHLDVAEGNDLNKLALELLSQQNARETCLQVYLRDLNSEDRLPFPSGMTILHMISLYGLADIASQMPEVVAMAGITDSVGNTPLDRALDGDYRKMSLWLLNLAQGRPDEYKRIRGIESPLRNAAANRWEDVLRLSIQLGEDIDGIRYNGGNTALHWAATEGFLQGVEILLAHGANLQVRNFWGDTPLISAAEANHDEILKILVNAGAMVNAHDMLGKTALHYAAVKDNVNVVDFLLRQGSDPNINTTQGQGETPLHVAAGSNATGSISLLHAWGADFYIKDALSNTPLRDAIINGCLESVELILSLASQKKGSVADLVSSKSCLGYTPLHDAAANGEEQIVRLLLKNEAPLEEKDHTGHTALHLAVKRDEEDLLRHMIRAGADITATSDIDENMVHMAANLNCFSVLQELIDLGADPQAINNIGLSPLHIAARLGHMEFLTRLLENVPLEAVNKQSALGETALHLASRDGNVDIVKLLFENGAASLRALDGDLAIHYAAAEGHLEMLDFLSTREEISATGLYGYTALHHAALNGHNDAVDFLLENGAELDVKDEKGRTPLLLATMGGRQSTVSLLLAKGADIRASTSSKHILLHEAVESLSTELVVGFLDGGLDPYEKDSLGRSIFMTAVRSDRLDMIKLLLQSGINGSNDVDKYGNTCVHFGAINNNLEMLNFLHTKGLDVTPVNKIGYDALLYAIYSGSLNCLDALLRLGCNVEGCDFLTRPLQGAAVCGFLPCIDSLLSSQVELDSVSLFTQNTPLLLATSSRRSWTAARLVAAGASLSRTDECGLTPLNLAQNHEPTRSRLIEQGIAMDLLPPLDENQFRPKLSTIISLANSFTWQLDQINVRDDFQRCYRLLQLGRLLLVSGDDDSALELARLCLMEHFFCEQTWFDGVNEFECEICKETYTSKDVYLCMRCDDVELCASCHKSYVDRKSAPDGFLQMKRIESQIQEVEESLITASHSPELLDSLFSMCPPLHRWLNLTKHAYEIWDYYRNWKSQFGASKRPGQMFVEVVHRAIAPDSSQRDEQPEETQSVAKELQKLNNTRKRFKEYEDFTCSGHEFFFVSVDEWQKAKEEGILFDENGKMRKKAFEDLLRNYESLNSGKPANAVESENYTATKDYLESSPVNDDMDGSKTSTLDANSDKETKLSKMTTNIQSLSLHETSIDNQNDKTLEGKEPPAEPADDADGKDRNGIISRLRDKFLDVKLDPYDAFKLISAHLADLTESQHLALIAGRAANFISEGSGTAWFKLYEEHEKRRSRRTDHQSHQ